MFSSQHLVRVSGWKASAKVILALSQLVLVLPVFAATNPAAIISRDAGAEASKAAVPPSSPAGIVPGKPGIVTPYQPSEFTRLTEQFEEPLLATGPTSIREDRALLSAMKAYRDRPTEDDFSSLSGFLSDHPRSVWRVALLTNLGLLDYHYGYLTRALSTWEEAWKEGKAVADPRAKPLIDRGLGELVRMHARLGHAERLETLIKEIGERAVTGQATEALAGAKEGLWMMKNQPGQAYLCGPFGLRNLMTSLGKLTPEQLDTLNRYQSGVHGVTLSQLDTLATQVKLSHRIVYRAAGQPVPVPSVAHWKVNHFASIVAQDGNRFHLKDPTFGNDLWITRAALDAESTGYFLVPEKEQQTVALRDVPAHEADQIWGMGVTNTNDPDSTLLDGDILCIPCIIKQAASTLQQVSDATTSPSDINNPHMAGYNMHEMVVSLHITDTPVGYAPPIGPGVFTTIVYNQREANQPATFTYFNSSPKWTLNWLAYIQDDPRSTGNSVNLFAAGGGLIPQGNYTAATGTFSPETRSAAVLNRMAGTAISYQRQMPNGSYEIYSQSDGSTSYPRRVFLTKIVDPAGNAVTLNYDGQLRLTSITDATGRNTTFSYGLTARPLLVTQITDPFGRSAEISYDATGRLIQITDTLGIKSQFAYDANSLVNAMTTPYGTTNFAYGSNGNQRYLQVTDPMGHTERLEYNQNVSSLPFSDPANTVPVGLPSPFNEYLYGRDSFFWDKHVFATYGADYTKARNRHWTHMASNNSITNHTVESINNPLERRIWMYYPGESSTGFSGTYDQPSVFGRVLDDGSTQLYQKIYNAQGHITDMVDPIGRETQTTYAANGIDPLTIKQKTSASGFSTIAQFTWNAQHRPLTSTDAAGQVTHYTYNAAGQLTQMTDALGETTTYNYDPLGYSTGTMNANNQTQSTYTRDAVGRIATSTDSEGYTFAYAYDAFDRVVAETYPDGTTRQYGYTNLDLTSVTDRQGKVTQYAYDGERNLIQVTDPLGNKTKYAYFENQILKSLTDANGNTTSWNIDIENRPTGKQYADGTQVTNTYETTTNRVKTVTDALGQVKQFAYNKDDSPAALTYSHAVNPTPNVSFTYDPYFQRVASMTDGTGTTNYTYYPIGATGALQLQKEATPFTNGTIAYQYDVLGRPTARTVDSSTETFAYDTLSRLITHGTALGSFNLSYLGQTQVPTSKNISTGTVGTTWQYDTNINDRRLIAINNSGATRSFTFTTTPENLITHIQESAPTTAAFAPQTWDYIYNNSYDLTSASSTAGTYSYNLDGAENITGVQSPSRTVATTYNNLNQIATSSGATYVYDLNGNVIDDGVRTYTWDSENRLLSVVLKNAPAKSTVFRYNGKGRRIAADVTNADGTTESRYLWCGEQICQARNSTDLVIRRYYSEGEYLPTTSSSLYYSRDQVGSVRDVLASQTGSRVAAFDYEPYGNPTQSSGRANTDFRYAGLFYDQQDGLYLTHFRPYDPSTGTWLSRDPLGEAMGSNLHAYVRNPLSTTDTTGACPPCAAVWVVVEVAEAAEEANLFYREYKALQLARDAAAIARAAATLANSGTGGCECDETRTQAQTDAHVFAGIPLGGGASIQELGWDQFNGDKAGLDWANFQRMHYDTTVFQYKDYDSSASVEEHPLGHPGLPGGQNHDCPHFHAVNSAGQEKEFPYMPGSM